MTRALKKPPPQLAQPPIWQPKEAAEVGQPRPTCIVTSRVLPLPQASSVRLPPMGRLAGSDTW